jgi:hypothetical protein
LSEHFGWIRHKERLMANRKNHRTRRPTKSTGPTKEIYTRMRREFSAADLQKYTRVEKGIPANKVLAEMEQIHRKVGKR